MQSKSIQEGDTVKVHYRGKLTDGQIFDSSFEREPIEVNVGAGQLIKGFELALVGMTEGQTKSLKLSPQDAYGDHNSQLVRDVEKKFLPQDMEPQVGMQLQIGENEDITIVTITNVTENHVKLDANHPLAGKDLEFDIQIVEVKKAS